jgi:hypothetical protein
VGTGYAVFSDQAQPSYSQILASAAIAWIATEIHYMPSAKQAVTDYTYDMEKP